MEIKENMKDCDFGADDINSKRRKMDLSSLSSSTSSSSTSMTLSEFEKKVQEQAKEMENLRKQAEKLGWSKDKIEERIPQLVRKAPLSKMCHFNDLDVDVQELKKKYEQLNDIPGGQRVWFRPTQQPRIYLINSQQKWPGTGVCCSDRLPTKTELSGDDRVTCLGVANAYGTGKTHFALAAVEATITKEPQTTIAYASFSNGWRDPMVHDSLKNPDLYLGLWIFAAIHSTRTNKEQKVECCPDLFKEICRYYLSEVIESHHRFFRQQIQAYPNMILVFDEMQEFSVVNLDQTVDQLVSMTTRLCVLVGAFNAEVLFSSGHRLRNAQFCPLTVTQIETLFVAENVKPDYKGISLPRLLNGALRTFTSFGPNFQEIWRNQRPIECLQQRYCEMYDTVKVSGILFRAAISDLPCPVDVIRDAFKSSPSSLGVVMLRSEAENNMYHIILSPFQLRNVGICDVVDDTIDIITDTLKQFVDPNWSRFELLAGVGPALRLASLSHNKEMKWTLPSRPLQLVFQANACSASAQKILNYHLAPNLAIRHISGGSSVREGYDFQQYAKPQEITLVTCYDDVSAPIDHFLIVPIHKQNIDRGGHFLIICIDAKFSRNSKKSISWELDIAQKITNWRRFEWPKGWISLLIIVTCRTISKPLTKMAIEYSDVPLIISNNLPSLFGSCLVPVKYRTPDERDEHDQDQGEGEKDQQDQGEGDEQEDDQT
jgi:hypothetical protein